MRFSCAGQALEEARDELGRLEQEDMSCTDLQALLGELPNKIKHDIVVSVVLPGPPPTAF